MAPQLFRVDTESLKAIANTSTQEREGSLSPVTGPHRTMGDVIRAQRTYSYGMPTQVGGRVYIPQQRHLTLPARTKLINTEARPRIKIGEPIAGEKLAIRDFSESLRKGEAFPGLNQHWMSRYQQHIYLSLIFFAVGFSAITALAIAIIGWLSLDIAAYILIWPSLVVWLVIGVLYPQYGKLAISGFVIGLLACLFYDCMRFTAIALGLWGDFIPKIGMWLLHTNKPDWVVGYIWRYVGDGGFMGMAFVVCYCLLKPKLDVRIAALAFGVAIWLCLVGTMLLSPNGTRMLFPLTPITFSLSLLGHIIYGLSIGFLYPVFIRENKSEEAQGFLSSTAPLFQSLRVGVRSIWR